jgi:hypothetical protein
MSLTLETATGQPIFTFHLPRSTEHLDAVKAQMKHLGAPMLEVVDYGHTLVLLDGVHRLQAAYQLDVWPRFSRLSPEATLADAPLWCADAERMNAPKLHLAPRIFLHNWVITQAAMLTIGFGEAGIRFIRTQRGRIDLVQDYDPNDFRESIAFERHLLKKDNLRQFDCDVLEMEQVLKEKVGAAGFKKMTGEEGRKVMDVWHRRDGDK